MSTLLTALEKIEQRIVEDPTHSAPVAIGVILGLASKLAFIQHAMSGNSGPPPEQLVIDEINEALEVCGEALAYIREARDHAH
jgi:hypothetical protein